MGFFVMTKLLAYILLPLFLITGGLLLPFLWFFETDFGKEVLDEIEKIYIRYLDRIFQ